MPRHHGERGCPQPHPSLSPESAEGEDAEPETHVEEVVREVSCADNVLLDEHHRIHDDNPAWQALGRELVVASVVEGEHRPSPLPRIGSIQERIPGRAPCGGVGTRYRQRHIPGRPVQQTGPHEGRDTEQVKPETATHQFQPRAEWGIRLSVSLSLESWVMSRALFNRPVEQLTPDG